jgi:hypothetical protein
LTRDHYIPVPKFVTKYGNIQEVREYSERRRSRIHCEPTLAFLVTELAPWPGILVALAATEEKMMDRNVPKNLVVVAFLGSFLLLSGCMLMLGGAGGYLIRKGEEGGSGGTAKSTTTSTKASGQSTY